MAGVQPQAKNRASLSGCPFCLTENLKRITDNFRQSAALVAIFVPTTASMSSPSPFATPVPYAESALCEISEQISGLRVVVRVGAMIVSRYGSADLFRPLKYFLPWVGSPKLFGS